VDEHLDVVVAQTIRRGRAFGASSVSTVTCERVTGAGHIAVNVSGQTLSSASFHPAPAFHSESSVWAAVWPSLVRAGCQPLCVLDAPMVAVRTTSSVAVIGTVTEPAPTVGHGEGAARRREGRRQHGDREARGAGKPSGDHNRRPFPRKRVISLSLRSFRGQGLATFQQASREPLPTASLCPEIDRIRPPSRR